MDRRNRIVGSIALALGVLVVTMLVVDGRWKNHDTVKPIKALLGGFLFIGLGAWYLIRGDKAEPWRNDANVPSSHKHMETLSSQERGDFDLFVAKLERDPEFPAVYRRVEAELREKARQLEKEFDIDKNS